MRAEFKIYSFISSSACCFDSLQNRIILDLECGVCCGGVFCRSILPLLDTSRSVRVRLQVLASVASAIAPCGASSAFLLATTRASLAFGLASAGLTGDFHCEFSLPSRNLCLSNVLGQHIALDRNIVSRSIAFVRQLFDLQKAKAKNNSKHSKHHHIARRMSKENVPSHVAWRTPS